MDPSERLSVAIAVVIMVLVVGGIVYCLVAFNPWL